MEKRLNQFTIADARSQLDAGEISSIELTKTCLDEIRGRDGALHSFLEVFEKDAMEEAKRADARLANGERDGVLDGIPIALKDNFLNQGKIASAGSKILATHVSASDATVTAKLKEQGAVIVGRTNMDEFAMG